MSKSSKLLPDAALKSGEAFSPEPAPGASQSAPAAGGAGPGAVQHGTNLDAGEGPPSWAPSFQTDRYRFSVVYDDPKSLLHPSAKRD